LRILALFVCATALLSACSSVGVQYVPPTNNEKAAELSVAADTRDLLIRMFATTNLSIYNFDEKGCYAGMTALDDGSKVILHADKPIVISIEKILHDKWMCRSYFRFTPEENALYTLTSTSVSQCVATLNKSGSATGEADLPATISYVRGPIGLGCMKMGR